MSEQRERLFEFRIEYKKHGSIENNYHYYMAHNAQEALDFQLEMIDHRHWNIELIKLEKKCPYANKWIDESEVLHHEEA
jgi:hypothetical protein